MSIFAIADLHLGITVEKNMDMFGGPWEGHTAKLKQRWEATVNDADLVLVPGDISWALKLDEAKADIEFLDNLPGKKLILKGNHDYWWPSLKKLKEFLPQNIIPLKNDAFVYENVGIAGSRLWFDPDLNLEATTPQDRAIYERELERFTLSLNSLPKGLKKKIIMTHFPPISLDGKPSKAVQTASEFDCDIWVFGHMHLGTLDYSGFARTIGKTKFEFVSSDYIDFTPKLILQT
jgi:predicted phosphohydrolase